MLKSQLSIAKLNLLNRSQKYVVVRSFVLILEQFLKNIRFS